jgi:hypothetical protein
MCVGYCVQPFTPRHFSFSFPSFPRDMHLLDENQCDKDISVDHNQKVSSRCLLVWQCLRDNTQEDVHVISGVARHGTSTPVTVEEPMDTESQLSTKRHTVSMCGIQDENHQHFVSTAFESIL